MRVAVTTPLLPSSSYLLWLALFFAALPRFDASAQVTISGIVVDSVTFAAVPHAHIGVRGRSGGTVADEKGNFSLKVAVFDTVQISAVGYLPVSFPILFDQEDIMILMREDVTYLREIIVTGKPIRSPLIQEKRELVYRRPQPSRLATGSGVAFDYFSREQRERRKLQKLVTANEKVFAYNKVITDPDFREAVRAKYGLTEEQFYGAVLTFNQQSLYSIEYKSEEEVRAILDRYFCSLSDRCP